MPCQNQKLERFVIPPGDRLLTGTEVWIQYKISRPKQCRLRREGDGPPFVVVRGRFLYPESGILQYLNSGVVRSTAELDPKIHGNRYKHLEDARKKALEVRKLKAQQRDSQDGRQSSELKQ